MGHHKFGEIQLGEGFAYRICEHCNKVIRIKCKGKEHAWKTTSSVNVNQLIFGKRGSDYQEAICIKLLECQICGERMAIAYNSRTGKTRVLDYDFAVNEYGRI